MFNYFASKTASNFAYIYLAIKKAHKKQVKIVIGFDVILKLWPGVAEQGMALSNNFTALEFYTKKSPKSNISILLIWHAYLQPHLQKWEGGPTPHVKVVTK